MAEIPVVGAVLKWARDFRCLSLEEAAKRIDLPAEELEALENGTALPSLTKFERMARVYRLPTATLFRRTKPREPNKPSDYRTFEGAAHQESFEFSIALSETRTLQAALDTLRT